MTESDKNTPPTPPATGAQCQCPHIYTSAGLVRSGWSSDCSLHRQAFTPQSFRYTAYTPITDGMSPRLPRYIEQQEVDYLRELVEHMDKRLKDCEAQLMLVRMNQAGGP